MNEQKNVDISKVINIIMENPALIEQISSLVKQDEVQNEEAQPVSSSEKKEEVARPVSYTPPSDKANRTRLLGALKPYLSSERAKAIDSMISIAEVLDMMKTR